MVTTIIVVLTHATIVNSEQSLDDGIITEYDALITTSADASIKLDAKITAISSSR
jgi:hypothetical protein